MNVKLFFLFFVKFYFAGLFKFIFFYQPVWSLGLYTTIDCSGNVSSSSSSTNFIATQVLQKIQGRNVKLTIVAS